MLFSRLSLTGLPPAPSAMLPQAPQHLPAPQHSLCKFSFFFLVVLHLLTLVSKCYLQFLRCPIPLCHIPTLCQHHPLHTLSTPLLASSGCVNALVTAPICPRLNVSFFFFIILPLLTPASLSLRCPFMPRPFPHAASALLCCIHSLVPRPFSHATLMRQVPAVCASEQLEAAWDREVGVPPGVRTDSETGSSSHTGLATQKLRVGAHARAPLRSAVRPSTGEEM